MFHSLITFIFTCLSFYSYKFTRSSDSLNLHIQICSYLLLIRYLERITSMLRNLKFFLFDYLYSYLTFIPVDFLFSTYITFSCHFILYQRVSCVHLYVVLQWYRSYLVIIKLVHGYFRLSVYTWGIFLAYIRRHNVSVSLGSGRYIVVSEPRFDIKENLVPTCNLRQLCWHCNIHILFTW